MSKISLSPDASGTGIFTIASPNSNTNRTLTLPDDTGTIVTNSGNQAGSFTTLNTSGQVVFNDAGADVDFRVEGDTDANLLFVDASTERVGIGLNNPSYKLDVSGDTRVGGATSKLYFDTTGSDASNYIGTTNDYDMTIYNGRGGNPNIVLNNTAGIQFKSSTTVQAVIDSSGNVGIGVTPSAWGSDEKAIDIGGANQSSISGLQTTSFAKNCYFDGTNWIYKQTGVTNAQVFQLRFDGGFSWNTAAAGTAGNAISFTQAMTLDANGNLLVGNTNLLSAERFSIFRSDVTTSALTQNIQNNGATSTSKAASSLLRISSNASGADSSIQITDNVANNYWFGGNLAGAYVMANTNGVRLSSGGTSWASDSDERIKDIIEPITDGLNKVNSLRPIIGKYKTDDEDKRRVFLIAQDVQAVLPEAVFENEDTLMLQYTDVIPLLVSAVKDLKAELDTVKTELATLKG